MPKTRLSKRGIQELIQFEVMGRNDLAFTHSIMCQCFLPLKRKDERNYWLSKNGKTSLILQPLFMEHPEKRNEMIRYEVPYGAKARLIFLYLHNEVIKRKTQWVVLGKTLNSFMARIGVGNTGPNYREIKKQMLNIIHSHLFFVYEDEKVIRRKATMFIDASQFEKDDLENNNWFPEVHLSDDYFKALMGHQTPIDFRAMVGLQKNPRAMDAYQWLSYRLYRLKKPTQIPYSALHELMGKETKYLRNFKIEFNKALDEAIKFYLDAKVEYKGKRDYITIYPSKAPIADDKKGVIIDVKGNPVGRGRKGHFLR